MEKCAAVTNWCCCVTNCTCHCVSEPTLPETFVAQVGLSGKFVTQAEMSQDKLGWLVSDLCLDCQTSKLMSGVSYDCCLFTSWEASLLSSCCDRENI